MLSFEEKLAIADSFPELERKDVSMGRVNYHYDQSISDKKTVVYHLHPNGNGFVYAGQLKTYKTDDKGMVNIREFNEEELRAIIADSIHSLSPTEVSPTTDSEELDEEQLEEELWVNDKKQTLSLICEKEDQMWYIYAGENLDSAFETYEEAEEYLLEEGFSKKK